MIFLVIIIVIVVAAILNSNGGSNSSLSNKRAKKRNIQQQNIKSIHNVKKKYEKWYTLIDNHGLSETELKDALEDIECMRDEEFVSKDGTVQWHILKAEITWIQKKGGKKYNSFEEILRLEELSTETRKDLLEFIEVLRDVQRWIGKLPPKPVKDLNINSGTNNSNYADEFNNQKGPISYPKEMIQQIEVMNMTHKMQALEISTVEASISELASYLEHPYIQLKDYQKIFDGLAEVVGMLIGVLIANYRNGSHWRCIECNRRKVFTV